MAASEVVRDAVTQMVRQFADSLAFFRELVQNSIDAGASAIDVRISLDNDDASRPMLRIVVADDGCGMDRAAIESCMLVLFRSSKDGDASKIGKFGVGFFSVFAVAPERVRVDTGLGENKAEGGWRVTLLPDYSYTIETTPPRRGTTVTLRVPTTLETAARFATDSGEALSRWCAHVELPVRFRVGGIEGADCDRRIDSPFGLDATAAIVQRDVDGTTYALAPSETPGGHFYNRGILLHSTVEPLAAAGVVFKINSPALGHTLSRDNVRRDATFDHVIKRAGDLARGPLRASMVFAFNHHARLCARARHAGVADETAIRALLQLARAVQQPAFMARADEFEWPLLHPNADGTVTQRFDAGLLSREPRLYSAARSHLTRALVGRGMPIVDTGVAHPAADAGALLALFMRLYGQSAVCAPRVFGAPRVIAADGLDPIASKLLAAVRLSLGAAGLSTVGFADPIGAGDDRLFLALDPEHILSPDPTLLIDASDTDASPFALFRTRGVAIHVAHPRVRLALRAATIDADVAGLALARLVLLAAGKLDAARDHAMTENAALRRVGS